MAMISCRECGKEISDTATACVGCGAPVTQTACKECGSATTPGMAACANCGAPIAAQQQPQINVTVNTPASQGEPLLAGISCPRCNSNNISFQREQSGSVGASKTTFRGGHGCLYWLLIGWWMWFFKAIFHICTLGIFLLIRRRKKLVANTVTGTKNINRTMAVCQSCGNSWKVK